MNNKLELSRFSLWLKSLIKQTEVIDEINFEIPYGRVGKLFEGYAYAQLQKLFDHRKTATIRTLQDNR